MDFAVQASSLQSNQGNKWRSVTTTTQELKIPEQVEAANEELEAGGGGVEDLDSRGLEFYTPA
jgi:hypothetical protein